jgi:hypothetical protein
MKSYFKTYIIIISGFLYFTSPKDTLGQNRWVKSYFGNLDTPVSYILEAYDHGYLMLGWYGHNYPTYLWLIKTDINGDILWQKTIGDGSHSDVLLDMAEDQSGNIFLAGLASENDPQGDPLIIKINPCGNKEWCKVFYTENHFDFASCLTLTTNGGVAVAIFQINSDPQVDRICLAKLSKDGELFWKHCYTTVDTSQRNEDIYDIIVTPDKGFLLTGFCDYEDPEVPNKWWLHPYFLKTDSLGNFEWETVLYKETNLHGGIGNNTVISPNGQYYYSSISHYFHETNFASPALAKLDMEGNVIGVYDVVTGFYQGKLSYAQFLNDSTLAASAGWGDSADDLWDHAVIIDTLGNLFNSTVLVYDLYTSILQITYDGKLAYASNTYQNDQFDCYLTKLNQNLEDDTLYSRPFTYDSLCPYQIESDTIVQDDCGVIVGVEEPGGGEAGKQGGMEAWKHGGLEIWPNPASGVLSVKCLGLSEVGSWELVVYDIFGKKILPPPPAGGEGRGGSLDVSALPPGIYFVSVLQDGKRVAGGKFIVAR